MSNLIKLEKRLNRILDSETEKGYENANTEIISECADMLLRMDSAKRYALTADEFVFFCQIKAVRNAVKGKPADFSQTFLLIKKDRVMIRK